LNVEKRTKVINMTGSTGNHQGSTHADPKAQKEKVRHPQQKQKAWTGASAIGDDTLLLSLEIISGILGRPMSVSAFRAGLPLVNGKLTPDLFTRAAARSGLAARVVRKKLDEVSKLTLPCVLLLEGNKACILAGITDTGEFEVIFPESGRGSSVIHPEDLQELYSDLAIFVKPEYQYDQRSIDLEIEKPRSWFWGTLWRYWPIYSHVVLAAILINLFAIASPLFTMNVYDRVVPNNATETLTVLSIGVLIIFAFDFLLKTLRVYFVDVAGKNADVMLASRIFEQVMGIQLASRPLSSGGFANQLREFETLREFFSSATLVALVDLPFIGLFIVVVYFIGGPIALVPLCAVPIVLIGATLFQMPLTAWVKRTFREGAQKHALLVEAINGLETVKSFGAEGKMQRNWENFVNQSAGSSKTLRFISSLALNYSAFVQQAAYVMVIIVGVYLIGEGLLSMGGLIACSILSARALAPLAQTVGLLTRFNQSMTALEALDKIIKMPVERPKGKHFVHRPVLKGTIELKEVNFSYPGQKAKALKDFSLEIKASEKIGMLGRIGSGKTTVEKLILGLYTAEEGSVRIDGTDIRQLDPAELRRNIGYVPQDIYLFFGTVRDNILFGSEDFSDAALLRAAEVSGVAEFTKTHPQGFDMPVGEGGSMLSGGQRQSIAVARALIRDPNIFIFDEPTAQMDHASEARFITRLEQYMQDKTMILITHRMPLLRLVNRLAVIDSGRVIADGPKDEVIKALSSSQIRSAG